MNNNENRYSLSKEEPKSNDYYLKELMEYAEKQYGVQHSITTVTEKDAIPKERGAFNERWSDFGKKDLYDEFVSEAEAAPQKTKEPPAPDPKQVELNRLCRQYYEMDKKYESAKGKRFIATILVFTIGYFALLAIANGITSIKAIFDMDLSLIGINVVLSIIFAWIHFWANATIFGQLSEMGRRESAALEHIAKQIRDTKKTLSK